MGHRPTSKRNHLILGVLLFCGALTPLGAARPRELSFEDRVRAQTAIERVYYSHQIGSHRPFEEVFRGSVLERKVRSYLRQSVALESFWGVRVTEDMLRAELARMSRQTRMPERLREIYEALGDDPILILECLARPALVDRLTRNFFAWDQRIHEESRRSADALRLQLRDGTVDPQADRSDRYIVNLVRAHPGDEAPSQPSASGKSVDDAPDRMPWVLDSAEFDRRAARLPARVGEIGPLEEERERFVVHTILDRGADSLRIASFMVQKRTWDDWWREAGKNLDAALPISAPADQEDRWALEAPSALLPSAGCTGDTWDNRSLDDVPDPRYSHTAVWTGSAMLVWGGYTNLASGARYDPATDTWTSIASLNAPSGRFEHAAVWTGQVMVVWGSSFATNSGGRYDPVTDAWSPTSLVGAPTGLSDPVAVWSGSFMIVWGQMNSSYGRPMAGGRYDPVADTWMSIASDGAPVIQWDPTVIWTGTRMLIWGGSDCQPFPGGSFQCLLSNSGFQYDPTADTWSSISQIDAPSARTAHSAVWTGSEMIVWGGYDGTPEVNTGGRYNPSSNTWTATSTTGAPASRYGHTAIWTGSEMIVWGGRVFQTSTYFNTGGRYNPVSDSWLPTTLMNAPSTRTKYTVIWDGRWMIVWGGVEPGRVSPQFHTGGRYDPSSDSWTPTSTGGGPTARYSHTAVWTGVSMVVWGGSDGSTSLGTGGRYNPATDTWTPTSTLGAPSGRVGHTAIWTGQEMIVWGSGGGLGTGGRYDASTDVWAEITFANAPSDRHSHSAVWTGSEMIVWGGYDGTTYVNSGGRYNPSSDTWTATSTTNAPSGRYRHTAVWSGSLMIVWGGGIPSSVNSGGRYDPLMDSWTPTSLVSAPTIRQYHSAIWTGQLMVVWGGNPFIGDIPPLNTGGRYDPYTDVWTSTSMTNAPTRRYWHTAVWSGNVMIVWGGSSSGGAVYHPPSDSWASTSLAEAPGERLLHIALWGEGEMFVWGGRKVNEFVPLNSGGRYCPGAVPTYFRDSDGDGHGDPSSPLQTFNQPPSYVTSGDDCTDADPAWWDTPSEVRDLQLTDPITLGWSAPSQPGGVSLVYDGIRSSDPVDFISDATCVASDIPDLTCTDADAPALGRTLFYLVRAQNGCPQGQGPAGSDSNGVSRDARTCP